MNPAVYPVHQFSWQIEYDLSRSSISPSGQDAAAKQRIDIEFGNEIAERTAGQGPQLSPFAEHPIGALTVLSVYNEAIEQYEAQEYLVRANTDYAKLALAQISMVRYDIWIIWTPGENYSTPNYHLSQSIPDRYVALVYVYKALGRDWKAE